MAKKKFQWEAESGLPRDTPPPPRERSRQKRDADAVDALVQELLDLPPHERTALPLEPDVVAGLAEIERLQDKGTVRGGLRRQRLYVAGLLRGVDLEALREAMPQHGGVSPREQHLQMVEHWRRRLIDGGDDALDELVTEAPSADRQALRQRIRLAKKEQEAGRPGKAFKALFADLRDALRP